MDAEKLPLYHLEIRLSGGGTKRLTGYPMPHAECGVMKSKFGESEQARILFVEDTKADPDHYLTQPMENQEAVHNREIAKLRSENALLKSDNEQLKIKLSRMCCDA